MVNTVYSRHTVSEEYPPSRINNHSSRPLDSMPRKTPMISTQEARLRLSLGIDCSWEDLGEKTRLRLNNAYSKIIAESFFVFREYDATLGEICQAMRQILSINPFCSDKYSEDLKSGAIETAESLLRSHGLPSPLPIGGTSLRRLRDEWPAIRSQRRRTIRVQKCKEYSLPLTSSWEKVRQQEMLVAARKLNEERADSDKRVRHSASAFRPFGIQGNHGSTDLELLTSLRKGVKDINDDKGYVYLKQWRMPNGTSWYKIGVTSNPSRREAQQNVLPVPAETIACVELETMERARSVERTFLNKLSHLQIRGANNRELFHMDASQLSAVMHALKGLAK